jgi:hypothetical protein
MIARIKMNTMTIHGIDAKLKKAIARQAELNNECLNQTAIRLLKNALGLNKKTVIKKYTDMDHLAGTWTKEEADQFMRNIDLFERIEL